MIDYRCPACRRLAFKADSPVRVRIALACSRCGQVVTPRAVGPLYSEYLCGSCGALGVRVAPHDSLPPLCVPCGVRMRPAVESPAPPVYVSVSVTA